jgi:hypothetical protein
MGLAIFLLAAFQVLGGVLRPKINENESKTQTRQRWELAHGIFGIMLFLFGVWQMYAGLVLYNMRYDNSNFSAVLWFYILWMGSWTGLIVGGTIYKWVNRKGEEPADPNANINIAPKAETAADNEDKLEPTEDAPKVGATDNTIKDEEMSGKESEAVYV